MPSMRGIKLLVLEDQWREKPWADEIEAALRRAGFQIHACASYEQAKVLLEAGQWIPDFALLDVSVDGSGLDKLGLHLMEAELKPRGIRCGHMSMFTVGIESDMFVYEKLGEPVSALIEKLEAALREIGKIQ